MVPRVSQLNTEYGLVDHGLPFSGMAAGPKNGKDIPEIFLVSHSARCCQPVKARGNLLIGLHIGLRNPNPESTYKAFMRSESVYRL